jgi:hypothetical protein
VVVFEKPVERRPDVADLTVEAIEPRGAFVSLDPAPCLFREAPEVGCVGALCALELALRHQTFDSVLADRLEHQETRFTLGRREGADEALVRE